MSTSSAPELPERRRFLQYVGLAGLGVMSSSVVSLAQTSGSKGVTPAAPSDSSKAAASTPPPLSDEAKLLAEIIQRRYGKHLSAKQLEAVTREIDQRLQGGQKLREVKLGNHDGPDFVFHV